MAEWKCMYCEREFDDPNALYQHHRSRHRDKPKQGDRHRDLTRTEDRSLARRDTESGHRPGGGGQR
jgi:hypothetical protein